MRKRILAATTPDASGQGDWLDVAAIAEVELTSEDPDQPVESALRPGAGPGWRAADAGEQRIRLCFDEPRPLRRIRLVFDEREVARTQEFVLRWSGAGGQAGGEVVRQQYNFSPPGTTRELEDYQVDLQDVSCLELHIVPALDGRACRASLTEWRLA